jgi:hypothetical protein
MVYLTTLGTGLLHNLQAIAEAAPAGLVAATASSYPAKGSFGAMFCQGPNKSLLLACGSLQVMSRIA